MSLCAGRRNRTFKTCSQSGGGQTHRPGAAKVAWAGLMRKAGISSLDLLGVTSSSSPTNKGLYELGFVDRQDLG
jgi:hypothetical protein